MKDNSHEYSVKWKPEKQEWQWKGSKNKGNLIISSPGENINNVLLSNGAW